MKSLKIFVLLFFTLFSTQLFAHSEDPNPNITPYNDAQESINGFRVQHLKNHAAWQSFVAQHPSWGARFNRYTKLPHRALGKPFSYGSATQDLVAKSLDFISSQFSEFGIPTQNLIATRNFNDGKYSNVNFKQVHNGMEVLWSDVSVRFSQNQEIVMFGLDAHTQIPSSLPSTISAAQALQFAEGGLATSIIHSKVQADKKIIPVPANGKYEYHMVYEVWTETQNTTEMPGKYRSFVDAETGKIWYRDNEVKQIGFTVNADLYGTNLTQPSQILPLQHLQVTSGSTNYYTDAQGAVTVPGVSFGGSLFLQGLYCDIVTGQNGTTTPTISPSGIVDNGIFTWVPSVPQPQIQHFTAYHHVNVVHDFMKSKLPLFTDMDNPLLTRVDRTDGNCNAFYNGSSINFYTTANGCNALSLVNSVIYHEYGHGISNVFYASQNRNFSNGGMGEGYSDVWAMYINDEPRIGTGFGISNPNGGIRRYDINPKIYPRDLTGEVHDNGEIIAGAWWDTYQYWGSLDSVSSLFAQSHYGLANGANGTEGQVYFDILIDALQYDDTDNNILNGTPHFLFIVKGFADHGIYLLNNSEVAHADLFNKNSGSAFNVHAEVKTDYLPFLGDLTMVYRQQGTNIPTNLVMNRNNTEYDVIFPSQTGGEIYEYYFQLGDNLNTYAVDYPQNAGFTVTATQRNLPYYVLIGYAQRYQELFNGSNAPIGWQIGNIASDDATRGVWEFGTPIPSFVDNNDSTTLVQTFYDANGDGQCLFTENATSATSALGQADVDGGTTTVITKSIDISNYTQPVLGYSRWYSNSQGTNPRKDFWITQVSYDNGNFWFPLERTYQPDVSWRRYIKPLSKGAGNSILVRFIAQDIAQQGASGSIVEAAIDALEIYDLGAVATTVNNFAKLEVKLYPNPAKKFVNLLLPEAGEASYEILSSVGQVLSSKNVMAKERLLKISTTTLADGIYYVRVYQNGAMSVQKLVVSN